MVKRLVFIVMFIVMASSLVFAQAEDEASVEEVKPEFNYTTRIVIGLTSFENISGQQKGYQRLGYLPAFAYGKWRFGFEFIFDLDGDFRSQGAPWMV